MLRLAAALLLVACASSSPREAGVTRIGATAPESTPVAFASEPASKLLDAKVPYQTWPALPGRAVGLLAPMNASWGGNPGWTRQVWPVDVERGGDDRYYFMTNGHSPWAEYFDAKDHTPAKLDLDDWQVPLPDGTIARYDAFSLRPGEPNPWGLAEEAHLVEIEVNDGRGSKDNYLHFMVTGVKVLDGTDAIPMRPALVLLDARRRWDRFVAEREAAIGRTLDEADRLAYGKPFGAETTRASEAVFPTWLPDEQRLRVVFYRKVMRGSTRVGRVNAPDCPPGAPCARPVEPMPESRTYGVELGMEIDFDAKGRVVGGTNYEPVVMGR